MEPPEREGDDEPVGEEAGACDADEPVECDCAAGAEVHVYEDDCDAACDEEGPSGSSLVVYLGEALWDQLVVGH